MSDLKTEIRSAFEKEQATNPPPRALRAQLVAAANSRKPARAAGREIDFRWLAVAATVLVTAALVAGLVAVRIAHRPVQVGPPPAGRPLLYVIDSHHLSTLLAYDWNGTLRGKIELPFAINRDESQRPIFMSPNGSRFIYQPQPEADLQYLDRLGKPIGAKPDVLPYQWMWADDSTHICLVRQDGRNGRWRMFTKVPGEEDRLFAAIDADSEASQEYAGLASCSMRNDEAIIYRTSREVERGITYDWISDVWQVRISSGAIKSHHTYPIKFGGMQAASLDGAYIVDKSGVATGLKPEPTVIRRGSDWAVVYTPVEGTVLAFSGDDSRILVAKQLPLAEAVTYLEIRDWAGDTVVANYVGPEFLHSFAAEPGGSAFALSRYWNGHDTDGFFEVVIIAGDGTTHILPGRYLPLW